MKQKISVFVLLFLLILTSPIPAYASEDRANFELYASYWQEGYIYSFATFSQPDPTNSEISLFVNNQFTNRTAPVALRETDATAHYLLLIDTSDSMERYQYSLQQFVEELMNAQSNIRISIAKCDKTFSLEASDLEHWKDVKAKLQSLHRRPDGSDICGGVANAIEYLGAKAHLPGDMLNLIVISDGIPWYSNNQGIQTEKATRANQLAASAMNTYSDITVHTLTFGTMDEEMASVLTEGLGCHFSVKTSQDAKNAGTELLKWTDSVYQIGFPLKGYDEEPVINIPIMLTFGDIWLSIENLRNSGIKLDFNTTEIQEPSLAQKPEIEPTETNGTMPTTPPSSDALPEESHSVTEETTAAVIEYEQSGETEIKRKLIAGCSASILFVTILLLWVIRRKRNQSVKIRVEVISGNVIHQKKIYYLVSELLIGTSPCCSIRIQDDTAAPVNSRIFKRDHMIYIEDMNSSCGTLIGGMHIYSSNRLRSGDEVEIGNTILRLLF